MKMFSLKNTETFFYLLYQLNIPKNYLSFSKNLKSLKSRSVYSKHRVQVNFVRRVENRTRREVAVRRRFAANGSGKQRSHFSSSFSLSLSLLSGRPNHHRRDRQMRCFEVVSIRLEEAAPREMRSTIARQCSILVENATGNSRDESGRFLFLSLGLRSLCKSTKMRGVRDTTLPDETHRPDQTTRANAEYSRRLTVDSRDAE